MTATVQYSTANAKLAKLGKKLGLPKDKMVYSLDMLSGHSCPFAKACKSKAVETPDGLRIQDGPHCQFRCFSASNEVTYPATYRYRKRNFEAVKATRGIRKIVELLEATLPHNCGVLRLHVAGDFFKYEYFQAVCELAKRHPDMILYCYTKAIPYLEKYGVENIPANFRITVSKGGTCDDRITSIGLPIAHVAYHPDIAKANGWPIDKDDSLAAGPKRKNFCVLLHGIMPAKSKAAQAISRMRKEKIDFSYQRAK